MKAKIPVPKTYATASPNEQRQLAYSIPTKLGHLPLRQGASVECSKCGMSGSARETLVGDVFTRNCGEG